VSLVERTAGLFLAPTDRDPGATPGGRRAVPALRTPAAIVLGSPADAMAVAWLLATELRLRAGGGCVLVGEWNGGATPAHAPGPAHPSTRRLAARLAGRGLDGCARGRTLHLSLPAEPGAAVAAWQRAVAAAGVPAVGVLAGPRAVAFDRLLDEQDLVVLAPAGEAPSALAELALEGLAGLRTPVAVSRPVPRGAGRVLAASSLATSRALGPAVTEAVRGLG
jgi:hypothetical protein